MDDDSYNVQEYFVKYVVVDLEHSAEDQGNSHLLRSS